MSRGRPGAGWLVSPPPECRSHEARLRQTPPSCLHCTGLFARIKVPCSANKASTSARRRGRALWEVAQPRTLLSGRRLSAQGARPTAAHWRSAGPCGRKVSGSLSAGVCLCGFCKATGPATERASESRSAHRSRRAGGGAGGVESCVTHRTAFPPGKESAMRPGLRAVSTAQGDVTASSLGLRCVTARCIRKGPWRPSQRLPGHEPWTGQAGWGVGWQQSWPQSHLCGPSGPSPGPGHAGHSATLKPVVLSQHSGATPSGPPGTAGTSRRWFPSRAGRRWLLVGMPHSSSRNSFS